MPPKRSDLEAQVTLEKITDGQRQLPMGLRIHSIPPIEKPLPTLQSECIPGVFGHCPAGVGAVDKREQSEWGAEGNRMWCSRPPTLKPRTWFLRRTRSRPLGKNVVRDYNFFQVRLGPHRLARGAIV